MFAWVLLRMWTNVSIILPVMYSSCHLDDDWLCGVPFMPFWWWLTVQWTIHASFVMTDCVMYRSCHLEDDWLCGVQLAGEGKQAFHVVVPSLPGFAFSSAPKQKGFGLKQVAKTLNQLMLELGYPKYVAQGLQGFLTTKPLLVQVFLSLCWSPCSNAVAVLHANTQLSWL